MKTKRGWKPAAVLTLAEVDAIKAIGRARGRLTRTIINVYRKYGYAAKAARVMDERYRSWLARDCEGSEPRLDSSYTVALVFGRSPRTIANIWEGRSWT